MDNNNIQVSVIIPVYNAEVYLDKCLKSVVNQDNKKIEVLLIDDGSTDKSGAICDKYAKMDSRISVIHKKNEGVSIARNVGLDMAKGEWVAFVDSDDEISCEYLTIPTDCEECDVVQRSYDIVTDQVVRSVLVSKHTLSSDDRIYFHWLNHRNNALWDKLIKREVIGTTRFIPGIDISEDFLFFTSLIHKVHSYCFSPEGRYIYYVRQGSAMSKFHSDVQKNIRITFEHLNIVNSMKYGKSTPLVYEGLVYGYFCHTLWRLRDSLDSSQKLELIQLLRLMQLKHMRYFNLKKILKSIIIKLSYRICLSH